MNYTYYRRQRETSFPKPLLELRGLFFSWNTRHPSTYMRERKSEWNLLDNNTCKFNYKFSTRLDVISVYARHTNEDGGVAWRTQKTNVATGFKPPHRLTVHNSELQISLDEINAVYTLDEKNIYITTSNLNIFIITLKIH